MQMSGHYSVQGLSSEKQTKRECKIKSWEVVCVCVLDTIEKEGGEWVERTKKPPRESLVKKRNGNAVLPTRRLRPR
jgi:hypothetical protein